MGSTRLNNKTDEFVATHLFQTYPETEAKQLQAHPCRFCKHQFKAGDKFRGCGAAYKICKPCIERLVPDEIRNPPPPPEPQPEPEAPRQTLLAITDVARDGAAWEQLIAQANNNARQAQENFDRLNARCKELEARNAELEKKTTYFDVLVEDCRNLVQAGRLNTTHQFSEQRKAIERCLTWIGVKFV